MEEKRKKRWYRRWWFIIPVIVVVVLGGLEIGLSKFLGYELRSNVSQHLNAELNLEGVWYVPPLSMHVAAASLDRDGEELASIGPSVFKLARIPLPGHPIVIQSIDIERPTVHLVENEQGVWGGLVKPPKKPPTTQPHGPPQKLSQILRLRHLRIDNGQVGYIDLRQAHPLPMIWRDIDVNVALQQKSAQVYDFGLDADTAKVAGLSLAGNLNVDTLVLRLRQMGISVNAAGGAGSESALPAPVQRIVRKYDLNGRVSIDGQATVPLTRISDSTYSGRISVDQATARLPRIGLALDRASAKIQVQQITGPVSSPSTRRVSATSSAPSRPKLLVTVQAFEGWAGSARFVMDQAQIGIDPVARQWFLSRTAGQLTMEHPMTAANPVRQPLLARYAPEGHVTFSLQGHGPLDFRPEALKHADYHALVYVRDASLRVPDFPLRFEGIGGELRAENGIISVSNGQASYGHDQFRLKAARVPIDPLPARVQVREITGFAHFAGEQTEYAPVMMGYLKIVRPKGTVAVAGSVDLDLTRRPLKPNFNFEASTDHSAVTITQGRLALPIRNIHADMFITPQNVRCPNVRAQFLDGQLEASGQFHPEAASYDGKYDLRGAHLERLRELLAQAGKDLPSISGDLSTNGTFAGVIQKGHSPLDGLYAQGVLEVIRGDFFRLPVLNGLLTTAHFGQSIGTVGELATNFTVSGRAVTIKDCAINSPLVGVQGSGRIGFDGSLGLGAIIAPLADWRDKIRQTKIPLLSDLAGQIAGAVQKLVNTATSKLLYQFRVEGTVRDPKIIPVPAPALTDAAAFVFGKMVQGVKDGQLLSTVKQATAAAPSSQPVPSQPGR